MRYCTRETYGEVPQYDAGTVSCDPNIIRRKEAIQNCFKVDYLLEYVRLDMMPLLISAKMYSNK